MVSVDESKKIAKAVKSEAYKKIGIAIRMAPAIVGMSEYRFCQEFAPYWGSPDTSPETVKSGLHRLTGIPKRLKCPEIIDGIEQAYQSYISDPKITQEKKALAIKQHDEFYPNLFEWIKRLFKLIDTVDDGQKWIRMVAPVCQKSMIEAFMSGHIPKEGEEFSQKEAEWLRAALVEFPPKEFRTSR